MPRMRGRGAPSDVALGAARRLCRPHVLPAVVSFIFELSLVFFVGCGPPQVRKESESKKL